MVLTDPEISVSTAPHRKIIHIDMDAFYASVEQRDNPDLRGKPVAVGGSAERGVVAAASYEARRYGVRSAMPSVTAKRQCPDLIFVKPRFEVYKAISRQIRDIFAEHTPIIEPLSLDEAYLDVTENLQGVLLARDIALRIREKIKAETGLNASAGVSYNKFLAKLASDHRKPDGQYVISPEMGPAFVEKLPVGTFHGIGPATAAKFNAFGIWTGLDIRNQSLAFLQEHFGKSGTYYYWISRAIDERPVRANRIRKSRHDHPPTPALRSSSCAGDRVLRDAVRSAARRPYRSSTCRRSGPSGSTPRCWWRSTRSAPRRSAGSPVGSNRPGRDPRQSPLRSTVTSTPNRRCSRSIAALIPRPSTGVGCSVCSGRRMASMTTAGSTSSIQRCGGAERVARD